MTNVNNNKTNLVSFSQFAKLMGKPAQYFYALHREDKMPADILEYDNNDKPYLKLEAATEWYEKRQSAPRGSVAVGMDPNQILSLLITWFDQAGKKDLSEALKKVQEANLKDEGVEK